jgi:hypothetical protein
MLDTEAEAARFDPSGEYVRRWLPALSRLPSQYIHAPWKAPPQVRPAGPAATDGEVEWAKHRPPSCYPSFNRESRGRMHGVSRGCLSLGPRAPDYGRAGAGGC